MSLLYPEDFTESCTISADCEEDDGCSSSDVSSDDVLSSETDIEVSDADDAENSELFPLSEQPEASIEKIIADAKKPL